MKWKAVKIVRLSIFVVELVELGHFMKLATLPKQVIFVFMKKEP